MSAEHIPVLAEQLESLIKLTSDAVIVDATVGYAGHSRIFGSKLGPEGCLIGLDVDEKCLALAGKNLSDVKCKVFLKKSNFSDISNAMADLGLAKADFILADLGWCSGQIVDSEKGLSFQNNMPLDMRLDSDIKTTAAKLVNSLEEDALADLIYKYGEERASRRIARFIVEYRRNQTIITTGQLSFIICRALGKVPQARGIHPATRTFQALRIAVNDELGNLEKLLEQSPRLLNKNGYLAIISFHSLEDRIVKQFFNAKSKEGVFELVTKKPIVADEKEIGQNPRSRSAKLRIARKI